MISLLRHSLAATLVSFVCFIAPGVRAQETGSSFGGGSFDDSSSGGSSYGGSYDSGGSDWGGSSYDGGGDGGSGGPATVFVLLMALLIVVVGSAIDRAKKGARVAEARPAPRAMDVSAISLAIDWHARRELQQRLDTLARSGDTRSKAGLVKLLRETVVAVRRLERSWLYAGVVNAKPSAPAAAEATFRRVTQEMRSRFRHELVRNADGATSTVDAPALRAREHEGAGVVVVTIAVAAKGEIPDVTRATNAAELREVMRRLGAIPALDLVAFPK